MLILAGSAPLYLQQAFPTRAAATEHARARVTASVASLDANDLIYQVEASRTYNPWPKLEAITAPVTWLNSADDFINPRNLDFPQRAIARMPNARFRMIPETAETRGHGTHTWARFWKADLAGLLARTDRAVAPCPSPEPAAALPVYAGRLVEPSSIETGAPKFTPSFKKFFALVGDGHTVRAPSKAGDIHARLPRDRCRVCAYGLRTH